MTLGLLTALGVNTRSSNVRVVVRGVEEGAAHEAFVTGAALVLGDVDPLPEQALVTHTTIRRRGIRQVLGDMSTDHRAPCEATTANHA